MNKNIEIIGHILIKDLTGLRWQALLVFAGAAEAGHVQVDVDAYCLIGRVSQY